MSVETIKSYIRESREIKEELQALIQMFNGVSIKQVLKKVVFTGDLSPQAVGLPPDIMQKLERYCALNDAIQDALMQALGGDDETK